MAAYRLKFKENRNKLIAFLAVHKLKIGQVCGTILKHAQSNKKLQTRWAHPHEIKVSFRKEKTNLMKAKVNLVYSKCVILSIWTNDFIAMLVDIEFFSIKIWEPVVNKHIHMHMLIKIRHWTECDFCPLKVKRNPCTFDI